METRDIERIIQENRYKLLGEILVSDADYEILKAWVKSQMKQMRLMRKSSGDLSGKPDLKLALGITQIAIHTYDGNFWESFGKELGWDWRSNETTRLGKRFIKTIKEYDLFFIFDEK